MRTLCSLFALSRRELAVLAAAFVLSLPAVTARIYSSDEVEYFSYLRSLWFDHDLSFENEYQYFFDRNVARAEGFHETFLENQTEAGRRPNFGTIGCALLWSPFYAAGDLAARVLRSAGYEVAADGYSRPYLSAVAYGSAVYGFLAVLLSIRAARKILSMDDGRPDAAAASLIGGVLVWIGTPLLFYTYVAPPMSHACSAFAVALFVNVWLQARGTWTPRQVAGLGVSAALMAMVREQDLFFAAGPALDFAWTALAGAPGATAGTAARRPAWRTTAGAAIAGCAAFAIAFLPQLAAYMRLNGQPGPSHLVTRKMTWTAPHALEVLFSPAHGFVVWTPLAVLAIAGLVMLAFRQHQDQRRVAILMLVMLGLQIYVSGSVESWTVAGAFGQRRFVALTSLLTTGLAALWEVDRRVVRRAAFIAVIVLCVWWNLALIALFGTGLMNRQRIELGRNAYDAFVTIPRMAPELAYRYFVNRESYYRNRQKP